MNPNASSSTPSDEGKDELEVLAKDAELLPRSLYLTVTQVLYRSEAIDRFYEPAFRVAAEYEGHFKPTMLTSRDREISEDLHEDVFGTTHGAGAEVPLPMVAARARTVG